MLKQRFITAVIALVLLLVALFLLPEAVTRVIIAALFFAAAWEWAGLISLQETWHRLMYVAFVAIVTASLWTLLGPDFLQRMLQAALLWWLCAFAWILFYPTAIPKPVGWLAGLLAIIPAWASLDRLFLEQPVTLLSVLAIVWAADIGAYFAGKSFGKIKLAPQVSPGKSWEGVIGGMLAVTLLAVAVGITWGIEPVVLVPLCLAVAVISIVGDLTVSMFKRSAGVKDSGTLFPGHGGVLDRIDSIMAAAPLFVLGSSWAGLR